MAVLAVIVALLIPCFMLRANARKSKALRQRCLNNLKIIGLAYHTAVDEGDSFSQGVEVKFGGSKEWLMSGYLNLHFNMLSNELSTPVVLACPADREKFAAPSFGVKFSNSNVSYFASLDAREVYPSMFLSGDRNLALAGKVLGPGASVLATNSASTLNWTRTMHDKRGNVGCADGSVALLDQNNLRLRFAQQEMPTNRLVFP